MSGRCEEGLKACHRSPTLSGANALDKWLEATRLAVMGRRREAEQIAEHMRADIASGRLDPTRYDVAWLYVGLADTTRAIELVTRVANHVHIQKFALAIDADLDPIRSNARFTAILAKLHLAT